MQHSGAISRPSIIVFFMASVLYEYVVPSPLRFMFFDELWTYWILMVELMIHVVSVDNLAAMRTGSLYPRRVR